MDSTTNLIYSKMILAGRDSDQIIKEREKDRNTINYIIEKSIRDIVVEGRFQTTLIYSGACVTLLHYYLDFWNNLSIHLKSFVYRNLQQ